MAAVSSPLGPSVIWPRGRKNPERDQRCERVPLQWQDEKKVRNNFGHPGDARACTEWKESEAPQQSRLIPESIPEDLTLGCVSHYTVTSRHNANQKHGIYPA